MKARWGSEMQDSMKTVGSTDDTRMTHVIVGLIKALSEKTEFDSNSF